jgi:hypothetical protein
MNATYRDAIESAARSAGASPRLLYVDRMLKGVQRADQVSE